jgi:glycosyltransferase involved in cell wall biosynthesis
MYRLYIIKRQIEDAILFPFIVLGKLLALMKQPEKEYEIYFFFPFYHIGGAEKVHAQVAQAMGNDRCIIYFTRRSHNRLFYEQFVASGCVVKDISKYTDNKFLYFLNLIYRGIVAYRINRQQKMPVVFNGQCNFGYKISPWINRKVPQVELIHSFNTFSWIRLPFLPFIHQTVMISKVRIDDHLQQYRRLKVPGKYDERIRYIGNGIKMSGIPPRKGDGTLQVLYVGRATAEKRVHLVARIAQALRQKEKETEFLFVGDAEQSIPKELHPYCIFHPFENDENRVMAIYDQADILMIVSNTEGFPMVVMEAMSRGCTIIATPVGDLPVHIKNETNGFLFSTVNNESQVIAEGVEYILRLKTDIALRQKMAENNIRYARENFSIEHFNRKYGELINTLKKPTH